MNPNPPLILTMFLWNVTIIGSDESSIPNTKVIYYYVEIKLNIFSKNTFKVRIPARQETLITALGMIPIVTIQIQTINHGKNIVTLSSIKGIQIVQKDDSSTLNMYTVLHTTPSYWSYDM